MSVAVREWGSQGDVPVVFWHALGDGQSGAQFADIAKLLARAGFHVVAVDGPGFDRSALLPAERNTMASLVEILDELLDERELDRPVVAGRSWGGAVATAYAGTHPEDVRALVLFDSGHLDPMSEHWSVIARHEIPTLLFLATEGKHGDVNRAHIAKFETALPHADVRSSPGTTPPLADEIAAWLVDQGL